jgi:hypothetical protein
MLRSLILPAIVIAVFPANAALLPDYFYQTAKSGTQSVAATDPALFEEYGFDQAEKAEYGKMVVTAWRFRDTTGAIAGFQYLTPEGGQPCDMAKVAVCTKSEALIAQGNYVLEFQGQRPKPEEVNLFLLHAPKYEQAPLPTLGGFLPENGIVPGSERYVLGPVGLDRYGKGLPPSVAAFHLSAEAEYARYKTKNSEFGLLLFSYPVPNMARDQAEAFRKVPGAIVKRTGPLVAVVMNPPNPDDAERTLSRLNYEATVTMNELPERNQAIGWARALLNMFALAGVILLFCIVSGLIFGGIRVLWRRLGHDDSDAAMIRLRLEGK